MAKKLAIKKAATKKAAVKKAPRKVAKPKAERVPTHPVHVFSPEGEAHLQRVRHICLGLPGTTEKLSHGSPTFFHKKVYCSFTNNHHGDGRVAVWIPAAPGDQAAWTRKSPDVYFKPPYVGVYGWVGILLDQIDDEELGIHLQEAWQMMGPQAAPSRLRQ